MPMSASKLKEIERTHPPLRGRDCVGVPCHNGDVVLYFKKFSSPPTIDQGLAVIADKQGRLRLSIGCSLIALIYKGEGGYHCQGRSIQRGFSLKGGGKIYHQVKMQVNNDAYGGLVFKRTDAIGPAKKSVIQEKVQHRGSYLLFNKIEKTYIARKQKEIIKKRKENGKQGKQSSSTNRG